MTVEISWPAVGTGCVVLTFLGKVIHGAFAVALEKRDDAIKALGEDLTKEKARHDTDVTALKTTQKLLFEKADKAVSELHEYKLHVAETYVAEGKLEKMLHPIERRLEAIENDLRGDGRGVRS